MLKSIHLRNFESHRNTLIEFSPGINIIAGASNHGKSSIIRGLYWIKDNKPNGSPMVSFWNRDSKNNPKKNTFVEAILSNGNTLRRERSPDLNGYRIGDDKLEAVGMSIPDEVTKVLNLSDVNMQYQFDRPFLLDESPAEVARFFNKTIRLDIIDKVQQKAEELRKSINRDIKNSEERIKTIINQIETYNWTKKVEPLIDELEENEKEIEKDSKDSVVISSLIEEYNKHQSALIKLEKISDLKPLIDGIDELIDDIDEGGDEFKKIKNLLQDKLKSEKKLQEIGKLLDLNKAIESIDKIDKSLETYSNMVKSLKFLINESEECQELINFYSLEEEKYKKLIPNICPLCGHIINKKGE